MKILNIIHDMLHCNIKSTLKNNHLAIAIRKGKPITSIQCNHRKPIIFGEFRGSTHAEMSVVETMLNDLRCYKYHQIKVAQEGPKVHVQDNNCRY